MTTSQRHWRFEFQPGKMIRYPILTGIVLILSCSVSAQKQIRTFYDPMHRHMKEDYTVSEADAEMIQGKYKRYFPNGKEEMEGDFIDGKHSGKCLEYGAIGYLIMKYADVTVIITVT